MAKPRQPIALIEYKGRKHLTKQEVAQRQAGEVQAPANNVKPPGYLSTSQKKEFRKIAGVLLAIGIMSDLDCDALGRYIQSQEKYVQYDNMVNQIIASIDDDLESNCVLLEKYENLRDKALKQCRACASDLGLTISSRCKLVAPKLEEPVKENKFGRFVK